MCLARREQRLLEQIGEQVTRSDPRLASMMTALGRLAEGEAMPAREQLHGPASQAKATLRAAAATAATLIAWAAAQDPRAWLASTGAGRTRPGNATPAATGKPPPRPPQARPAAPPPHRRNDQQPGQPGQSHP